MMSLYLCHSTCRLIWLTTLSVSEQSLAPHSRALLPQAQPQPQLALANIMMLPQRCDPEHLDELGAYNFEEGVLSSEMASCCQNCSVRLHTQRRTGCSDIACNPIRAWALRLRQQTLQTGAITSAGRVSHSRAGNSE